MNTTLREYHAPVWSEPVIMEMGYPGRRGMIFSDVEDDVKTAVGSIEGLVPVTMRRGKKPALPEMSEPEVLY
ncbi:MAG: glycine dehydrogenase subunit 2, partial [Pseudomonadota bacterium]|nr:glycine dehydrogenase subunit 2 [Pseudomonadota bacterium]